LTRSFNLQLKCAKRPNTSRRLTGYGRIGRNDAVKGFVVEHPQRVLFNLPALKVYAPEPDYLLAMKTLASRVEITDKQDILFLIDLLDLKTADEVFAILEQYYPRQQIKPATQFFVEELFEQINQST
jgi:hypothetical protein